MNNIVQQVFGPLGNGIFPDGKIVLVVDISYQLDQQGNQAPHRIHLKEIRPIRGLPGARLQPPPMTREFMVESDPALLAHINANPMLLEHNILRFEFPFRRDDNQMEDDDDDFVPRRQHSPMRQVKSKSPKKRSPKKSVVKSPKKRKSPKRK